MSTAIAEKKLSTRPVELGAHQRARQSKRHPDCRSTTIKPRVTKIPLALSPCRDKYPLAATAEMAILIVAVFPSRLSRYTTSATGKIAQNLQSCASPGFFSDVTTGGDISTALTNLFIKVASSTASLTQ